MSYAAPFYRSSRLRHLAAGLGIGLSLFLVASASGSESDAPRRPIDLDVQVIPGDCDSTGAEAYEIPYGPDAPPEGPDHKIRVVIRTCCCCGADSVGGPLGLLRQGSGTPRAATPRPPTTSAAPAPEPEVLSSGETFAPPPLARVPGVRGGPSAPVFGAAPLPAASVTAGPRVPWWLALLAAPAGFFIIDRMPDGTICDDSGPAVGPDRPSCDHPPRRTGRS